MAWRVPSRLIQQRKLEQPPPSVEKLCHMDRLFSILVFFGGVESVWA